MGLTTDWRWRKSQVNVKVSYQEVSYLKKKNKKRLEKINLASESVGYQNV